MSDALDRYVYDDKVARLQAEVDRLTMEREENREAIAELEFDNEGMSKLVASYKRVAVNTLRGGVLDRDGKGRDIWIIRGGSAEPAGSFDRDVVDEIHQTYEATR